MGVTRQCVFALFLHIFAFADEAGGGVGAEVVGGIAFDTLCFALLAALNSAPCSETFSLIAPLNISLKGVDGSKKKINFIADCSLFQQDH